MEVRDPHTHHPAAGATPHPWLHYADPGVAPICRSCFGSIGAIVNMQRDGTVFEVFDPRYSAFHLGLEGADGHVDRRSIGIEIASEGWFEERDGELLAFGRPFGGAVYDHGAPWREHRFFAAYTPEQVGAAIPLVDHLCEVFSIPRRTPADHLVVDRALFDCRGVLGHH